MITTTIEWFDPIEKLPEKDGAYLVYTGNRMPFTVLRFAANLSGLDDIDFPERYYSHRAGFVDFDETRYRWFEVPLEKIKYWTKIPEIKEETKDD